MTNSFTDINKIAEGFVFNGYNSLSRGSRTLENATNKHIRCVILNIICLTLKILQVLLITREQ